MFVEIKRQGKTLAPSLSGFISWLEQQDPAAKYWYWLSGVCPIGQYMESLGLRYRDLYFHLTFRWDAFITGPKPRTYGAALIRARALLNQ